MCDQFNVILLDFLVEKKIKKTKDQIVKQAKTIWPLSNHGKNVFYSPIFLLLPLLSSNFFLIQLHSFMTN